MTNADKHAHLLRFQRFQKNRERMFVPAIFTAIRSQYNQVIHHLENGMTEHLAIQKVSSGGITAVLKSLYTDAGIVYGAKVRSDLKKLRQSRSHDLTTSEMAKGLDLFISSLQTKARMPMGFSDLMRQLIADYFSVDILNQSEGITQTTRDLIQQVFTDAYEKGEGINDLIEQLKDTELSRIRARLIARTETVTAANKGAIFVAKDTGLDLNKQWLATFDQRTRRDHSHVNGNTVGIDDYFNVGGYQMEVPGDRGGKNGRPFTPAKEVCNCRCTTLFIPID